jgi:hypothetical protein
MGAWRRDFVAALATAPSCLWLHVAFLAVHIKVKKKKLC